MSDKLEIRKAQPDDFKQIFKLLKQLWPNNILNFEKMEILFMRNLNASYKSLICAVDKDNVIGFCSLTIKDNLWQQDLLGNVDELVVEESFRNKGIGRKLMNAITEIAIQEGCVQLELDSALHREAAHRFYRDLGFNARAWLFSKSLQ